MAQLLPVGSPILSWNSTPRDRSVVTQVCTRRRNWHLGVHSAVELAGAVVLVVARLVPELVVRSCQRVEGGTRGRRLPLIRRLGRLGAGHRDLVDDRKPRGVVVEAEAGSGRRI